MIHARPTSRRRFLHQTLATAAAAPLILPSRILGGPNAPSRRIQLGHIGTGGQGTSDLRQFLGVAGAASVALCDPFRTRREAAGRIVQEQQGHAPRLYNDFRELLADPGVDAVVIATPDHWHVPIGLAALRAGKDVYVEKPLGHSLAQNQAMLQACRETGRLFQYGTQQRSSEMIKRGVELVLNGHIGDLQRIEVWAPGGRGGGSLEEIPVPEGLDYELYLGPAPMRPCTRDRITNTGSWFCSDYALGFVAGWGAHPLDVAVWGMDSDTKGSFRISGTGVFPEPGGLFDTCMDWDVEFRFADGVPLRFMSQRIANPVIRGYRTPHTVNEKQTWEANGTTFFGTKGWVSLGRSTYQASNPEWLKLRQCEGNRRVHYRPKYYAAFVESVRERTPSVGPIEDAVRSDALSHLALMAVQQGGTLEWDPRAYAFRSPTALNAKLSHPIRGSWRQTL